MPGRKRRAPKTPREPPLPDPPGEATLPSCHCQDPAWVHIRRDEWTSWRGRLEAAVARLRSDASAYRNDNLRLAGENQRLRRSVAHELDLSVESPGFKNGLGGRTAVGTYRNENVAKFIQHMNTVGDYALARGVKEAKFFLMTAVKADLECLYAAAPASEEEGIRRADCEWQLSNEEAVEILAGKADWNEQARVRFMSRALSAGVDTSTQELVRRSGEMPQGKAPRPDDDEG
jgi:hypothetical protein